MNSLTSAEPITKKKQRNPDELTEEINEQQQECEESISLTSQQLTQIKQENALRAMLKDPHKRKKALVKLLLFTAEIILISAITARIPSQIWAMIVAIILGFILTKVIDILMKKYAKKLMPEEASSKVGEVHAETRNDIAESVISSWDCLPDVLKDQVLSLVLLPKTFKRYKEQREKEAYKTLLLALLESRNAFRTKQYEKAKKIAEKIVKKADQKKYELILFEANRILVAVEEYS